MGFSVSGSFAVIVVGALIGFGMFATATTNGFELVNDAQRQAHDARLDQQNTAIEIANATYNATTTTVEIEVTNTGSTELSVNATDVLLDNEFQTTFETRSVDGDASTDLWLPGETLTVEIDRGTAPNRVKIVTGPGVAETAVI